MFYSWQRGVQESFLGRHGRVSVLARHRHVQVCQQAAIHRQLLQLQLCIGGLGHAVASQQFAGRLHPTVLPLESQHVVHIHQQEGGALWKHRGSMQDRWRAGPAHHLLSCQWLSQVVDPSHWGSPSVEGLSGQSLDHHSAAWQTVPQSSRLPGQPSHHLQTKILPVGWGELVEMALVLLPLPLASKFPGYWVVHLASAQTTLVLVLVLDGCAAELLQVGDDRHEEFSRHVFQDPLAQGRGNINAEEGFLSYYRLFCAVSGGVDTACLTASILSLLLPVSLLFLSRQTEVGQPPPTAVTLIKTTNAAAPCLSTQLRDEQLWGAGGGGRGQRCAGFLQVNGLTLCVAAPGLPDLPRPVQWHQV